MNQLKQGVIASLLATFLVQQVAVHAATYYVAPTGSDTNVGTEEQPFKTIQRAASVGLSPGDTVLIREGRYAPFDLKNINGAEGAPITFRGEKGAIIDRFLAGPDRLRNIELYGGRYITIDGLELIDSDTVPMKNYCRSGDNSSGRQGIKFNGNKDGSNVHHITIKNMIIHDLRSQAILGTVDYSQFLNNHLHNNGGRSKGWFGQAYGLYLMGKGNVIRGNRVHGNNGNGLRFGGTKVLMDSIIENNIVFDNGGFFLHTGDLTKCDLLYGGAGIIIWHGSGNIIRNNVVFNEKGYGIRIDGTPGEKPNLVYNNTVYNNGRATNSLRAFPSPEPGVTMKPILDYDGIHCRIVGALTIVRNNISYFSGSQNIDKNCNQVSHNLTTDPSFMNPAEGDFRLRSGSAAIDAGEVLDLVTNDFAGVRRPQGAGYDIGAYEAGDGSNPTPPNGLSVR